MRVVCVLLFISYVQADKGINNDCVTPHGQAATCMELFSCRHLYNQVKKNSRNISVQKYLRQSYCGERNGVPLVCCGTSAKVYEECGVVEGDRPRIYGGMIVDKHFPWMAALQYKEDGKSPEFRCAGFLINPHFVVTAAHCLKYRPIHSVHLGISNLTNYQQHESHRKVEIINITYHEDYRKDLDDIGLIKIKPVKYSDNIRWICLPRKSSVVPDWFTLRGWGKNDRKIETFTHVLENRLMVTEYVDCPLAMRRNLSSRCIICAGGEIYKDSCEGDSGGALMNETDDGWTAFGVVSFGSSDCSRGDPAIYTRVQCYTDWIERKMLELLGPK